MIKKKVDKSIKPIIKTGKLKIEINGVINANDEVGVEIKADIYDKMIGAMLEAIHGDLTDLSWVDVVAFLRNDGIEFHVIDE